MHPMQQKSFESMKDEQGVPFPNEGGHKHDVGWHI